MSEPLVLSFKSDTTDARNAIANLASTVVSNMITIGSALKSANDNVTKVQAGFQALPGILSRAAAGFIIFEAAKLTMEAMGAAADAARAKLEAIVKVATNSRDLGVGTNFFQQWTAQAASLNIEADKLVAMLNKARAAATVTLGTNGNASSSPMQDLLEQHVAAGNISKGDLSAYNGAQSQEARIKVVLDLVDKLRDSGKELAALNIGGHMFGTDFENQLRVGVDLTGKMRESLTSIKDVEFPPDIVQKATELNDRITDAKKTMDEGWRPVQQDILRLQQMMLESAVSLEERFASIVATMGSWYSSLRNVAGKIEEIGNLPFFKYLGKINDLAGLANPMNALTFGSTGLGKDARLGLDSATGNAHLMNGQDDGKERPLNVGVGNRPDRGSRSLLGNTPKASGSQTDEVDTYIKSLQKAVDVLKAENETYGKSNTLKAEAVDLEKAMAAARQRGTPLTDAERAAVKKLADEEGAAKDKAAEMAKAHENAQALMQYAGNETLSILDKIGQKGTSLKSIIEDLAKSLLKSAEQAVLLGSGPLAGLFSTQNTSTNGGAGGLFGMLGGLFTPASSHADGGWAGFGPKMMVPSAAFAGARQFAAGGGIPAILHPGEIVLNQAQQGNVVKGLNSGLTIQIKHAPTINGIGLSAEQLSAVMKQSNDHLSRTFGMRMADWQRRFG